MRGARGEEGNRGTAHGTRVPRPLHGHFLGRQVPGMGTGLQRWPRGVFSGDPGGRVSLPDLPCWVKAAPCHCWVKNGSLGHAEPLPWEAGLGCGSPRCSSQVSPGVCQATGDRNKLIMIWDAAACKRLHIFTGHRDAVSVSWGRWAQSLWGRAAVSPPGSLTVVPVYHTVCVRLSPGPVLPKGHPPAVQCLPRPLCQGLGRGRERIRGDPVRPGETLLTLPRGAPATLER